MKKTIELKSSNNTFSNDITVNYFEKWNHKNLRFYDEGHYL